VLLVSELLSVAGIPNGLDEIDKAAGKNLDPDSLYPEGPLRRLSGIRLDLSVSCFDTPQYDERHNIWDDVTKIAPVCYVRVVYFPGLWGYRYSYSSVAGSFEGRVEEVLVQHGIRIHSAIKGEFLRFDFEKLLIQLAVLSVYMCIPNLIMLLLFTCCLGKLSKVYCLYLYEVFNIGTLIGGLMSRILANSVSYVELAEEDARGGISLEKLHERILVAFREYTNVPVQEGAKGRSRQATRDPSRLTASEAKSFAKFAFGSIFDPHIMRKHSAEVNIDFDAARISLYQFMSACADAGGLDLQTLVELVNPHRKMGLIERCFFPTYVWMIMQTLDEVNQDREAEDASWQRLRVLTADMEKPEEVKEEVENKLVDVVQGIRLITEKVAKLEPRIATMEAPRLVFARKAVPMTKEAILELAAGLAKTSAENAAAKCSDEMAAALRTAHDAIVAANGGTAAEVILDAAADCQQPVDGNAHSAADGLDGQDDGVLQALQDAATTTGAPPRRLPPPPRLPPDLAAGLEAIFKRWDAEDGLMCLNDAVAT
jgi:hypothetical protein